MPISPELARYAKEDAFTKEFLIPLLQRLGFSVVMYHGTREFGKDLVFAEIDRFGHVVYHGLQAKFVESVGLGKASQDLIYDAQQAFANPFVHPQTGVQQRISGFYAVNGGGISEQAREHFFNSLQPQFGANVRLLDGTSLVSLDKLAAFTRSSFVKERLTGLILEIRMNRSQSIRLHQHLEAFIAGSGGFPMKRLRTAATLSMLEHPVLLDERLNDALQEYWQSSRMANDLIDSAGGPISAETFREARINSARESMNNADALGIALEGLLTKHLAMLGTTIAGI